MSASGRSACPANRVTTRTSPGRTFLAETECRTAAARPAVTKGDLGHGLPTLKLGDLVGTKVRLVGRLHVPLPTSAVGADHPRLGLAGVATHVLADAGCVEAGCIHAGFGRLDLLRRLGLDTEVVEATCVVGVLEQHEFERWILDGEVCVTRLALDGFDTEELRVEVDGFVDVADVEGELQANGSP